MTNALLDTTECFISEKGGHLASDQFLVMKPQAIMKGGACFKQESEQGTYYKAISSFDDFRATKVLPSYISCALARLEAHEKVA